eukprot:scaffold154153_cov17-Tisochrysis_lutea.AAC.1
MLVQDDYMTCRAFCLSTLELQGAGRDVAQHEPGTAPDGGGAAGAVYDKCKALCVPNLHATGDCEELAEMLRSMSQAPPLMEEAPLELPEQAELPK